jgi:cytochrome b6-f complex iron-sulfur subunit
MNRFEVHDMEPSEPQNTPDADDRSRRRFLTASSAIMAGGLAAGYGTFGVMLGRFVYPSGPGDRAWLFVCTTDGLATGEALDFVTPAGAKIVVTRLGEGIEARDYLALSSVCPHLGCRVHWEANNDRFFCPCHNGAFDRSGKATEGPPKAANQSLIQFPLKVENGMLFVEAPVSSVGRSVADSSDSRPEGVA